MRRSATLQIRRLRFNQEYSGPDSPVSGLSAKPINFAPSTLEGCAPAQPFRNRVKFSMVAIEAVAQGHNFPKANPHGAARQMVLRTTSAEVL